MTIFQINGSLEEALSKLNSYSDMARALSQHSLASSVRVCFEKSADGNFIYEGYFSVLAISYKF